MEARLFAATFAVVLSLGISVCTRAPATIAEAGLVGPPTLDGANPGAGNLTIILKNSDFPMKARMTMAPCARVACVDI
jgi:hypothetical protein